MVRTKRVFDPKSPDDGFRVLVDRLWPRGVRKEAAALDYWAKELAPSEELREFYHHIPGRWRAFQARFRQELKSPAAQEALHGLAELSRRRNVTLLYASRETVRNNAAVLKEILDSIR